MRAIFEKLRVLAPTTISVLIEGETGTGKELVAQAIHESSDRAGRPFIVVDCGSIPASLAESILFGHEKGSFTGATSKRVSPFVAAHGGTVFLDELGELPLAIQRKLLRVLAEQRIMSVGGTKYAPVNVRVVAATRRDLLEEINRGGFRDDLYFRVAQERITVPPLRERSDDLGPILHRLFEIAGKGTSFKRVTAESLDRLERHDWPGNVRGLRNVVTRALAYDKGTGPIDLALNERPAPKGKSGGQGGGASRPGHAYAKSKEEHDRHYFKALFEVAKGNVTEMSKPAGLNRETLRIYLKELGIGTYGGWGRERAAYEMAC